ncbi:MAG: class I SAM-dependent methyltransferase [Thermoleophilia bacterium]|nr:class I SAM-dependent methyltransferase [Thermoleophilia bacterium]
MTHLNDPALVQEQYAVEHNLRARQALYAETTGPDPRAVLWETIAALAPERVLEVGGGEGWLAQRIAAELGAETTLVDLSPRMVELARARGVDAHVGDVQALPFPDATFDTVVAAWMLYHVPDLDRGLSEIARVLAPVGRLVANTGSLRHLEELRALVQYPSEEREWSFNAENGEEALRRHFAHVERRDVEGTAVVRDRHVLVAYQRSMSIPTSPVPDDVPLPFVTRTVGAVFVAAK